MITYNPIPRLKHIDVLLDGKSAGRIVEVPGGYQYVTNSGHRGQVFTTVNSVKKSLEILD